MCLPAGQGLLAIAIISPTGMPPKELSCKKQKSCVYNVSYLAEEKGDHIMTVHWGEKDVPGSPYVISVS